MYDQITKKVAREGTPPTTVASKLAKSFALAQSSSSCSPSPENGQMKHVPDPSICSGLPIFALLFSVVTHFVIAYSLFFNSRILFLRFSISSSKVSTKKPSLWASIARRITNSASTSVAFGNSS